MTALLEARGLEIRFGGVVAAHNVDIEIQEGKNLAIIGPNGAGKTTFLNICTGYLKPSAGEVFFDGERVTNKSPREITRRGVARAFQIPQLFGEHTALENLLIVSTQLEEAISRGESLEQAASSLGLESRRLAAIDRGGQDRSGGRQERHQSHCGRRFAARLPQKPAGTPAHPVGSQFHTRPLSSPEASSLRPSSSHRPAVSGPAWRRCRPPWRPLPPRSEAARLRRA